MVLLARRSRSSRLSRPGYGGLIRSIPGAVSSVANSIRMYKMRSAGRMMQSQRKRTHTGWLTNQYDVKTQYRRRRMPRRRRRSWVKKVRMVNYIANKRLASQHQLLRDIVTPSASANNQLFFSGGIYGENGTPSTNNDFGIDDLYSLDTLTGSTDKSVKYQLKSAVLDIELVNTGSEGVSSTVTVDCYEIICRKSVNTQGSFPMQGPASAFLQGFGQQGTIGTNSALTAALPGVTPFQNSLFCSHFKVIKKTRVLLSIGQATHFMFRDAKDRTYHFESAGRPVCSPGLYHGFLFIVQGVTDGTHVSSGCSISATIQRYYDYVIDELNVVSAGYTDTP